MWRSILFDAALGAVLVVAWYWICVYLNRRRSARILRRLDSALAGHGRIAGIEWISASCFRIRLRLRDACFNRPLLLVSLRPRQRPLHWIKSVVRKSQEMVTFEADLSCPPALDLDVGERTCAVRTRRFIPPRVTENWTFEHLGPFLISSRKEWRRDTVNVLESLLTTRSRERLRAPILSVSFRRVSPHFSATAPLAAFEPTPNSSGSIFAVLRELAAGASAPRL